MILHVKRACFFDRQTKQEVCSVQYNPLDRKTQIIGVCNVQQRTSHSAVTLLVVVTVDWANLHIPLSLSLFEGSDAFNGCQIRMFVMLSVKARTVRQQMFERDANLIAGSQYSRSEETRELSQFWTKQSGKSQNIGCFVRPVFPNTAHPVYTQQIC